MGRLVDIDEVLSNEAYAEARARIRPEIMAAKARRRIHVGSHLTFLFENHDTMLYQVQEMLRIEGTTDPADVAHEVQTYNEVLGAPGDLGCTLLIEIDDPLKRDLVLRTWIDLPKHLYAKLENGERIRAQYDERQVGDDRLSSVQYLRFGVGGRTPVALGLDMPDLDFESPLTDDQRAALTEDLAR